MTIPAALSQCAAKVLGLYSITNVKSIKKSIGAYQKYDVVISQQETFFREEVGRKLMEEPPGRILVQLSGLGDLGN